MKRRWTGVLLYLALLISGTVAVVLRTHIGPVAAPGSAAPGTSASPATAASSSRHTRAAGKSPRPSSSAPGGRRQTVTVTGDAVNTRYGPVQVVVIFSGSRITDVRAVQTPARDGHSRALAAAAVPTLRSEVLTSQSARIDTVSGATYTSEGYAQSVQSAIDSRP